MWPEKKHACNIIVLALAVLLVYGFTLGWPRLSWDDHIYIGMTPAGRPAAMDFINIFSPAHRGHHYGYRPVHLLTYRLDEVIAGGADWGYRLGNIFWHLTAVLLVYAGIFQIFQERENSTAIAFWGALFFAFFPYHVEAVAWIAERKGLVAGAFMLLALNLDIHYRRTRSLRWLVLASLSLILSLLSKSMWVSFPLLAGAVMLYERRGKADRLWLWTAFPIYLVIAIAGAAIQVLAENAVQVVPLGDGIGGRLAFMVVTYGHYLAAFFRPYNTMPVNQWAWSFLDAGYPPVMWILFSVLTFIIWIAGAYWWWRKTRSLAPALALCWFVLSLAPVANIVPMLYPHGDRFFYGPSLALLVPLGWLVAWIWKKEFGRLLAGGVALLFVASSVVALLPWQSNLTLWQYAVLQEPSAQVARFNLAVTCQHEYGELEPAEENYVYAIKVPSGDFYHSRWAAASMRELMKIYLAAGRREEAIRLLKNVSNDKKFPQKVREKFAEEMQRVASK